MHAAPNFNIKTSKSILIEYGDGTYEFVKPENFYIWNETNLNDDFMKEKKGIGIKFSNYAANIIFGIE